MCGIVGAYKLSDSFADEGVDIANSGGIALDTLRILRGNKNRGQDGFGLTYLGDDDLWGTMRFFDIKSSDVKQEVTSINDQAIAAIGHARYPTSGSTKQIELLQPFERTHSKIKKSFSFVFNGNIANAFKIQKKLERKWKEEGAKYRFRFGGLDTEVLKYMIIDKIANGTTDLRLILESIQSQIDGACNIGILTQDGRMAVSTDIHGFRPLSWGLKDGTFMFSSEEHTLASMGVENIHHLGAGRIVEINKGDLYDESDLRLKKHHTPCSFELIYFSDPKSTLPDGTSVAQARYRLGQSLAQKEREDTTLDIEGNEEDYVVMGIPASADYATKGYAEYLELSNVQGIIKRVKSGRTFIATGDERADKINKKYEFVQREAVKGKKLILTDDSIVRGSTMKNLIERVRKEFEPSEIHVRIPAPAVIGHCSYGLNMHTRKELFASQYVQGDLYNPSQNELDEMAHELGIQSLSYLPVSSLEIETERLGFANACMGCLTGNYPTKWGQKIFDKQFLEAGGGQELLLTNNNI